MNTVLTRRCTVWKAFVWLGLALLPSRLAGQAADTSGTDIASIVTRLPFASQLRLESGGKQWSGRLASRSTASLKLTDETSIRSVSLPAIDSLWVQSRQSQRGVLSGAAFGTLMFGVLQLGGDSSEDPGLNTRMGLIILGGATVAGLLLDATSSSWERRYPVVDR